MRVDITTHAIKSPNESKGRMKDLVISTEFSSVKLVVIADGSTGSYGSLAITALQQAWLEVLERAETNNLSDIQEIASEVATNAWEKMRREGEEKQIPIETTFSALAMALDSRNPQFSLCRLGDSGFVAMHRSEIGITPLYRASTYGKTSPLRSWENKPSLRWESFSMSDKGQYMIRLYSDGIFLKFDTGQGQGDEIYTEDALLSAPYSAVSLIRDIEAWKSRPDNEWAGQDDIAVAAIDIFIK